VASDQQMAIFGLGSCRDWWPGLLLRIAGQVFGALKRVGSPEKPTNIPVNFRGRATGAGDRPIDLHEPEAHPV